MSRFTELQRRAQAQRARIRVIAEPGELPTGYELRFPWGNLVGLTDLSEVELEILRCEERQARMVK